VVIVVVASSLNFPEYSGARIDLKPNPLPPASLLGDHSVSDPPDPIPNSAVKPDCADGTIAQALEE
jgi:hypothetical protein